MAEKVPIRAVYNGSDTCGLSELRDGEVVGVEHGGLGACTLTTNGVLLGNTQGAVQVSSALTTNGQLLIGGTSGPAVANVTGTSNEVEITSGDGSITIGLPSTVCVATKVISPALCITSQYVLPSADGSAGQVMCTDGSGALAFATNTPASPGGSDTYVQFNDGSSFGGSANFTWDDTTLKATNFCTAGTATLATVDINAGAIDGTTIGAASAAAITGAALTATGNVSFDGGTFIFNESGADKDFRVEGDTDANLFMADASTDRIGIGTATPSHLLDVDGVAHVATCLITPKVCITSQYVLPAADGSAGQILCTDGSGTTSFAAAASSGHTIAEDGSALASRTCLNFCGSGVTVTDCSATDSTDVKVDATGACMPIRVSAGTQCYACLATATIAAPCLQCDSAPKLGGSLDVNGNSIISASNGNIPITPNGSGIVIIDGLCHPIADGSAGQLLCTDGSAALKFATAASSGHTIANAGSVLASRTCLNFVGTAVTATDNSGTDATDVTICATNAFLPVREADGTACCVTLATAAIGECLQSDTSPKLGGSLDVNGNSIVSDAGNENIPITPHGTGSVVISKADINGGAIDGTIIGAASAAAITGTTITGTTLDASGDVSFDGGTFVFNESGADKDFRIEGDTAANLFIADASTDRIGIGTATPSHLLDIEGVGHAATCFVSAEVCATTKVSSVAICVYGGGFASGYVLPAADGSAGQLMCTNGSGAITFATATAGVTLAGSTNNTIATVTGANALTGEANLTFDGSVLAVTGAVTMANAAGPTIVNEAATATNPTLIPNKAEVDTGIGWAAADSLTLITGGAERMRINASGYGSFGDAGGPSGVGGANQVFSINSTSTSVDFETWRRSDSVEDGQQISLWMAGVGVSSPKHVAGIGFYNEGTSENQANMRFYTSLAGTNTERMRITSAGLIGVSNTSPATYGDLNGVSKSIVIGDTSSGNGNITIANSTSGNGRIAFTDTADNTSQAYIRYNHNTDDMDFYVNGAQRMIIDDAGNMLLGGTTTTTNWTASGKLFIEGGIPGIGLRDTTAGKDDWMIVNSNGYLTFSNDTNNTEDFVLRDAAAAGVYVQISKAGGHTFNIYNANASNPSGMQMYFGGVSSGDTTDYFNIGGDAGGTRYVHWTNGDWANVNNVYGSYSDVKLKQDIIDARSYWDDFKALRYRKYRLKEEVARDENAGTQLGLVAQEIEAEFPYIVSETPDRKIQDMPVLDEDGNATYKLDKNNEPELDSDGNPIPATEDQMVDLGTTTKSIKYSILHGPVMATVVQELQTRLEAAEAEIAILKG